MHVLGMTRVRGCCTFVWMQEALAAHRVVFARAYHCAACVGEMARSARLQGIAVAGSVPMDRVRDILSSRREELVERWRRQLRAASEAGFRLDDATSEVLPELLDATDRALVRRFHAPQAGSPPNLAEARRSAIQSSLLGDFLFDAALETAPGLNAVEQRLLSDSLAHAAVEVQVRAALDREQDRRRREGHKLARLAHELRNSATSATLALDLLRRRGALPADRTARALERSLSRLRDGIEDGLLDGVLTQGGLRFSRLKLDSVLADAHAAAEELGAAQKKLTVLLDHTPSVLQVRADPRVMRPALRGLLRAAVQIARPGATIRCGSWQAKAHARVAVSVNECQRTRGNRLSDLQCLALARRAAKAHGGSLIARLRPDGARFRLDLPSLQPH